MPAFVLRDHVRIQSGIGSGGVDYELRGLITESIVPGSTRLHFNPFAKSINSDNDDDAEDYQYGMVVGVDHRLNGHWVFIADYIYSSAESEGYNAANHQAEFGLDLKLSDHQKLAFALLDGLDGDDDGPAFGAEVSYMLSFGG